MYISYRTTAAVALWLLSHIAAVVAGFSTSGASNIAVYWGQNSHGVASGAPGSQQRLSYYCSNTPVNIIPLAFMNVISNPTVNFANAGDNCTLFPGSSLLHCPQLEEDIQTCQSTYGKTIMLSVGGATYTEGGFSSQSAAVAAADTVWAMFGPVQSGSSVHRPFGNAIIDGFDFDFEASTSNMVSFASELRSKMDTATAAGGKPFYLSAAPQCPYPDAADNDMLAGAVSFDFVMVQFYNNYCGLQSFVPGAATQNNFDFSVWDTWAKTVSKNPKVRIFLGIPGSSTAAGSGYASGSSLTSIVSYVKQFSSFGGIMIWDMSQAVANTGFLSQVAQDLASGSTSSPTTTTNTVTPRSTAKTSTTANGNSGGACTSVSTTTRTVTTFVTVTATAKPMPATSTSKPATTFTTVTKPTTTMTPPKTSTTAVTTSLVQQWGQCGGIGYTGPTQCEPPHTCVANGVWWAQCQ